MASEFRLPDIGEGLTEAEIVQWLVPEGEYVEADQPLVEVETDKAVVEIPSPYAGTVLRHGGAEGEVIEVGSVLVVIGEEGEATEPVVKDSGSPAVAPDTSAVWEDTPPPMVGTLEEEAEVIQSVPEPAVGGAGPVKALPVVRKLARDNGIDIETVTGTGPGGRITRDDVEAAIATSRPAVPVSPRSEATLEGKPAEPGRGAAPRQDQRVRMSRLRRTIASNMARSWAEIPHVTTFDDVDATRLLEVRQALGERHNTKIPLEALVVRAVVPALDAYPDFNSTLDGDDLIVHGARDIGIAVDTPDGLMVAVIRDADSKGVLELAEEIRRLGDGAKERKLSPDELTGQTFTISNIGALGGGHGTPIVPPGTTGILSVGRAQTKPIVYDGDLAIAPMMPLSLSYDHRVIDGGQGRRFMALLIENLEEPALFLA
ncbi:MAG: dihydrolipoamide acetyltransferase family protein [Actinomycetota bacterium]|nr:dihydrolipoamide acetyltransferase family protein [Actinomycetota bacterium]